MSSEDRYDFGGMEFILVIIALAAIRGCCHLAVIAEKGVGQ